MFKRLTKRETLRKKRTMRVRKKVRGTGERPRLTISKTNNHIFAQVIDDSKGVTIVSFGTQSKEASVKGKGKEAAKSIGMKIGELAKKEKVEKIVIDRGRFKYHGVIAELVEAVREAGIQV